jgi:hypothetical protein
MSDLRHCPFTDAIAPTPDPTGGHEGMRGGFDIPDGKKETPDSFGTRPTLWDVKDAPANGGPLGDISDASLPGSTIR